MATRRSRLQIKPNILGGAKTSGKISDNTKATNNEVKESTVIKSPKVKSPTRIMSPRRSISVNKPRDTNPDETSLGEIINEEKKLVNDSGLANSAPVLAEQKSSDKDNFKSDLPVLPTRARLRKFGKVNVGAARGVKTDQSQTTADNTQKAVATKESDKNVKPEKASSTSTDDHQGASEKDQNSKSTDNSRSSNIAPIPRRSRFPKAKPNIADIGRRKQRSNVDEEKSSQSSAQSEDPSLLPEIKITDSNEKTVNFPSKVNKECREQDLDNHHNNQLTTSAQSSLLTQSAVVPKSPLKPPLPTIPVTPEKRSRALSTSEPVVVKRPKKTKVDAPTDQPPDRATMKMRDLIRWNPTNNPMKVNLDKVKPDASKEKENVVRKELENIQSTSVEKTAEEDDDALPVPQVTIGPDGNIVINEKSLVVKNQEMEKGPSQDDAVIDETDTFTTYGSFRKSKRSKRWSEKETKKFYKALAMIGIDFFLICQLFPGRSRFEIKKKFQKEEKINRALVEKVLRDRIHFDPAMFDAQENEESSEEEIKTSKKMKTKKSSVEQSTNNKSVEKQKSTNARPSRKRNNHNYYDDDASDEDGEHTNHKVLKTTANSDEPWQPPSVSQKDGEVVGILMDMSEGRLNSEGQLEDTEETLIATPLHLTQTLDQSKSTSTGVELTDNSSSNPNLTVNNLRTQGMVISSYDSLSRQATEGIPIGNLGALQGVNTSLSNNRNETVPSNAIILPVVNNSAGVGTINVNSEQMQYKQNSLVSSSLPGLNISSLHPQSLLQRQPVVNTEDNDQYVLVTVVPEGGGETVIHVYRLHGGVDVGSADSGQPQDLTTVPVVKPAELPSSSL